MTPTSRTPQQRDRRFARVRMITRTIFVGSSALSIGMVGYLSNTTKLHPKFVSHVPTTTTTVAPTTTSTAAGSTGSTGSTGATTTTPPTTTTTVAPTTTTTVCTTSPSGTTTCY